MCVCVCVCVTYFSFFCSAERRVAGVAARLTALASDHADLSRRFEYLAEEHRVALERQVLLEDQMASLRSERERDRTLVGRLVAEMDRMRERLDAAAGAAGAKHNIHTNATSPVGAGATSTSPRSDSLYNRYGYYGGRRAPTIRSNASTGGAASEYLSAVGDEDDLDDGGGDGGWVLPPA